LLGLRAPIYFPLAAQKESFVALVSIHRFTDDTLRDLLADHLLPAKRRLEGELDDLRTAKTAEQNRAHRIRAERGFSEVQRLLGELTDFIANVTEIAERGPPPPDDPTPKREVDARYQMELEDRVLVNSSALWPLLDPLWKEPKKWWKQLAERNGPKGTHFDWSRTAARYFPARVAAECEKNPVLAAAHGCLRKHHPAVADRWAERAFTPKLRR
jgi:hypothetical protein